MPGPEPRVLNLWPDSYGPEPLEINFWAEVRWNVLGWSWRNLVLLRLAMRGAMGKFSERPVTTHRTRAPKRSTSKNGFEDATSYQPASLWRLGTTTDFHKRSTSENNAEAHQPSGTGRSPLNVGICGLMKRAVARLLVRSPQNRQWTNLGSSG